MSTSLYRYVKLEAVLPNSDTILAISILSLCILFHFAQYFFNEFHSNDISQTS